MHPKIAFPGEAAALIEDLSAPLHMRSLRNPGREAVGAGEVPLAAGYSLAVSGFDGDRRLSALLDDFRRFMGVVMECPEKPAGWPIRLTRGDPGRAGGESHVVDISRQVCVLTAREVEGLRRALVFLEDEMLLRRAPILPIGRTVRHAAIDTRIIRSPIAPYRWLSGWELEDDNDYYPDAYLNKLAHAGINGIWVAGLLRNLVASRVIPEMGPAEHRLAKLRHLVERADRYGIKVWFFCIEPRALPLKHPAAAAHPDIVGLRTDIYEALCPCTPLVLEYVREAMRGLFTEAPGLGGVINIVMGERPTTCWWHTDEFAQRCPRCRTQSRADGLSAVLDAFMEGIRSASPTAELMVWPYTIDSHSRVSPLAPMIEVMKRSRADITWMGNFEHGGVKEICGKPVTIREYSLSYTGPSPWFDEMAQAARGSGRRACAKLQTGTSYEISSVPYLAVPGVIYDKLTASSARGVGAAMLGWIPGGYPGVMLKAAGEAAFEPRLPKEQFLQRMAAVEQGEARATRVASAWRCFEAAWQRYPFDNAVLYYSPITRAPAYQLHLERESRLAKPYNFGLERTRVPQPWEDQFARWTGVFTIEEVTRSFRDLAAQWGAGIEHLRAAPPEALNLEIGKDLAIARAVRAQCLSTANVCEFYSLRDSLLALPAESRPPVLRRMQEVALDETRLTGEMRTLMFAHPGIGWHPEIYAYSYSAAMLEEKLRQLADVLLTLRRWETAGVDAAVLQRTVEDAERLRPDRWGD